MAIFQIIKERTGGVLRPPSFITDKCSFVQIQNVVVVSLSVSTSKMPTLQGRRQDQLRYQQLAPGADARP